jgi:hypothetical protein
LRKLAKARAVGFVLAIVVSGAAHCDEGMWTFDHFPAEAVTKSYGVTVTPEWLDHVRLSTVRLTNCTASFVSPDGLMITNHHCLESCLGELSSKDDSLMERGFMAAERSAERRCATQLGDVLVSTEDITAAIAKASAGLSDRAANAARKKALTEMEQACEQGSARSRSGRLKCQSVSLYDGGQYFLYRYKRYDDVRLVFTPETDIAAFGGDPDNFQYPRWSLDFAMLRAYENGKPAATPNYLRIDFSGPKTNQLVFVSGHPGSTSRLETRAQLEFDRDVSLPLTLLRSSELRGGYIQFSRGNPADMQLIEAPLSNLENTIKVRRKLLDALHEDDLFARKKTDEEALRPLMKSTGLDPWAQIESGVAHERELYLPYTFVEGGAGFNSILFRYARLLLRGADERAKPNDARLREYTDSALPHIEQQLYARVPIYAEVETLTMSFSLQRMQEWLGPDQPLVRRLLARDSPESLATRVVAETRLGDAGERKRLWEGGRAAVAASRDPMIELARSIDADARALRTQFDDDVEAPIVAASAAIANERFKVFGTRVYPDATFTLRLNYGTVAGWTRDGAAVEPFTHLGRVFERANGVSPFKIPDSWMKVKSRLDMSVPFCISTNNDIVGGNSGSALIDAEGRMVGLVFDGNIDSIAGAYWFDASNNRAVAVHPAIIREALEKVYDAKALLAELGAS